MSTIVNTIQKMKHNKEYESYFFRNASKYQNLYLWLEPLKNEDYFTPKEDLNLVLDYLEAVSLQNKDEPKNEVTETLLDIVNQIINYRKEDGTRIDNYFTDWFMGKIIFNLPKEKITLDHIKFIGISLRESKYQGVLSGDIEKIVMPILLENEMKGHLLELLKIIFDYKIVNKGTSYHEREPLIETYWLESLLRKHSQGMIKLSGIDGLKLVIGIIKQVILEDKSSFNNVWIATIEAHPQNSFPDRYDNQIVSFTRDLLEDLNAIEIKSYIKSFLKQKFPLFKRLALHTMNQKYDELKDVFWEWFNAGITVNTTFRHELYKFLEDRSKQFTEEEFSAVIKWIESLKYPKYNAEETPEQLEKYTAYRKKEWLLCLKQHNKKAQELYEKYDAINPSEIEHAGFDMWSSGFTRVGNRSPIENVDVFCTKSVDDIVIYIKTFNPSTVKKEKFTSDGDLVEGLANDLASCIKKNPQKFSNKIEIFHDLHFIYKYHLVYGFVNGWKDKQKFDWEKLFDFILKELNDDFFQSEEQYAKWLRGEIANLIEYGTKDDKNAFGKEHLPKAKEILFRLLHNKEDEKDEQNNNLGIHVLNSINGKALHALINYALRYGRLNSTKQIKWEDDVKAFFTYELMQNTIYSKSIFTILGHYLPHLSFLDKQWVDDNFNCIFPIENDSLWEISITGYFGYATTVYTDIYEQFKKHQHIAKALEYEFKSKEVKRKVIEHICIMFTSKKDNQTIFDVIDTKNRDNILEIIRFIWQLFRDKIDKNVLSQINILWSKIYQTFKDDDSSEAQAIFSTLSKWFVYLDVITDAIMPQLKLTAKYTEKNHNAYFIIEQLSRLVEKNPKFVGELYLEMLSNGVIPTYKQENIENTVETLYRLKEYDNANEICNRYRAKGVYFLNELSKKHEAIKR